jgi:hypothetical protein
MVDLEIGTTYNFTTELPWNDRVIFKLAQVTALLSYRAVNDKEALTRELERIEPLLPDELKGTRWANEEFYLVDIKTNTANKQLTIPRLLINDSGLEEVNNIEYTIMIESPNLLGINNTLRLLTDHGVKFKEVN